MVAKWPRIYYIDTDSICFSCEAKAQGFHCVRLILFELHPQPWKRHFSYFPLKHEIFGRSSVFSVSKYYFRGKREKNRRKDQTGCKDSSITFCFLYFYTIKVLMCLSFLTQKFSELLLTCLVISFVHLSGREYLLIFVCLSLPH